MEPSREQASPQTGPQPNGAEQPLLSERVYAYLKRDIIFGHLEPNAKIVERDICEQMGVSRTPLREALLRLAADGLVVVKPQSGTLVAPITVTRVINAQFIREKLECGLMRRVVDRWTRADQATLEGNIAQQEGAAARGDLERFHDLDEAFHNQFAIIARLPEVWTTIAGSKPHLDRLRIASLERERHVPELIRDHRDILQALTERDAGKAKRHLRAHLRQVLRSL